MPTVFMMVKPCYVCGTEQRCPDIGAPGVFHGPRDLDGRQSVAQRASVYMWVQRCENCGYCAIDIARGDDIVKDVVKYDSYRRQLNDPSFSETANSFLCRAVILEKLGDPVEAGWACVYAAWVCDDSQFEDSSITCRLRAVEFFRKAQAESIPFAPDHGQEVVLLADLLRRAQRFDDARKLCDVELSMEHTERTRKLLAFISDLAEDRDYRIHSESEGLEE